MSHAIESWLADLIGQIVVVDLDESYMVIGTLHAADNTHLALTDVDLHDHNEANCTKEVYLLETKQIGIRTNRKHVAIPRSRLIAISRLEDITT